MKRHAWLVLIFGALSVQAQSPPPQAAGYNLVFSDNFATLSLCTTSVTGCNWYYPGLTGYGATGVVTDPSGTYVNINWTSAEIYTTQISTNSMNGGAYGHVWTYGYFEISAALTPSTGSWPALWLQMANWNLSHTQTGPEIDILEWQSNTPTVAYSTTHTWNNGTDLGNNAPSNTWTIPGGSSTLSSFNTYGMLWTSTAVSFYFNNTLELTVNTTVSPYNNYYAGQYAAFLVLSQQAGCNFVLYQVTPCSGQVSPLNTQVQWVHVFQAPASSPGSKITTGAKASPGVAVQ